MFLGNVDLDISAGSELTLKGAGGHKCPMAIRSPAISHKNHLEVSKLLTFPKIMLTKRWYSYLELSRAELAVQILGRVCKKHTRLLRRILEKSITSLAQKLTNSKFSSMIFLFLPLVSLANF